MSERIEQQLARLLATWITLVAPAVGFAAEMPEVYVTTQPGVLRAWDNVEGKPFCVGGVMPSLRRGPDRAFELTPGACTYLLVPGAQTLRLTRTRPQSPGLDALSCAVSRDAATFVSLVPNLATVSNLFIRADDGNVVVRLQHASPGMDAFAFAAHVSRHTEPEPLLPFDRFVEFDLDTVLIRNVDMAAPQHFGQLNRGQRAKCRVAGPSWMAIESHLLYGDEAVSRRRVSRIAVTNNNDLARLVEHDTALLPNLAVHGKSNWVGVGEPETAYIHLPNRTNDLVVRSYDPIAVRFRIASTNHFPGITNQWPASFWDLDSECATSIVRDAEHAALSSAVALRLARDRRFRDGGLWATELLGQMDSCLPYCSARYRDLQATRARYTFYRDVLPLATGGAERLAVRRFLLSAIQIPGNRRAQVPAAGALMDDTFSLVGKATFVNTGSNAVYEYGLTPKDMPGNVRLLVLPHVACTSLTMHVSSEDGRSLRVDWAKPSLDVVTLPPRGLERTVATWKQAARPLAGPLGQPFAGSRYPAPLVEPGFVELPVSAAAGSVTLDVRAYPEHATPLVAVQERAASAVRVGQADVMRWIEDPVGDRQQVAAPFLALLRGDVPECANWDAHDRVNAWVPIARLVRARYGVMASSVAGTNRREPNVTQHAQQEVDVLAVQVRKRLGDGGAVDAEALAELFRADVACQHPGTRVELLDALAGLGDDRLAENLARGIIADSRERPAHASVYAWLDAHLAAGNNRLGRSVLLAYRCVVSPDPETLQGLVTQFLDEGDPYAGLLVWLALPPDQRVNAQGLRAAAALGWPRLVEYLADRITDADEKFMWHGVAALNRGDKPLAYDCFARGGDACGAWTSYLDAESAIVHAIDTATDAETRLSALQQWQALIPSHPAALTWRSELEAVTQAAGGRLLYLPTSDLNTRAVLSTPDTPVKLCFAGPLEIEIGMRPLHTDPRRRLSGWLELSHNGSRQRLPVYGNTASRTAFEVRGDTEAFYVGVMEPIRLRLGVGIHELVVGSADMPFLVQIRTRRPEIAYTGLPSLTRDVAAALIGTEGITVQTQRAAALVINPGQDDRAVELSRMAATLASVGTAADEHQVALLCDALHRRLESGGLSMARDVLAAYGQWVRLRTMHDSAGIRMIEYVGWAPESPRIQIRKALLPQPSTNELAIIQNGTKTFDIYVPSRADIRAVLHLETVPYARTERVTVSLRHNQNSVTNLTLDEPGQLVVVPLRLERGAHHLEFSVRDLAANHFVYLQFVEDGGGAATSQFFKDAHITKRQYHIATPNRPVELRATQAAWYRVHRWLDGIVRCTWHLVDDPEVPFLLTCPPEYGAALYRVYRYEWDGRGRQDERAHDPLPAEAVAPWLTRLPHIDANESADGVRSMAGRRHEDGTWSCHLGVASRHTVEGVDASPGNDAERYAEFGLTHRLYRQRWRLHMRTRAFARIHEDEGDLLAIEERAERSLESVPFRIYLLGRWMGQETNVRDLEHSGYARVGIIQRRELHPVFGHAPTIAVFGRYVDGDWPGLYPDGELDQDISSPYKHDHRYGIMLADSVRWKIRRNARLGLRVGTASNENWWEPDYLDGRVSGALRLAPIDLVAQYRETHYFADDDRDDDERRRVLSLEASIDAWRADQDYGVLTGRILYDLDENELSAWVTLHLHRAAGRLFRDFMPDETRFAPLRRDEVLRR